MYTSKTIIVILSEEKTPLSPLLLLNLRTCQFTLEYELLVCTLGFIDVDNNLPIENRSRNVIKDFTYINIFFSRNPKNL